MFQAPLFPSSGAHDYTDVHSMWHVALVLLVAGVVRGCRLRTTPTISETKAMCHML